ncbi:MAG: GNAT family N-acetyltransferase [Kofleriaceae bacterium]
MIIRSLALKTELGLAATRGVITDRGNYVVIETPDDPGYYYGNLLIAPAAPQAGEVATWIDTFHREFRNPEIQHVTLCWDGTTGDVGCEAELLAGGFRIERVLVLAATTVTAPPVPNIVELSPKQVIESEELAWACADSHAEAFREFVQRRARWQAQLVMRGLAKFFGIFDGTELVASLGLVPMGNLARYQDVQTASTHRKRGYASALLAAAAAAVPAQSYVIIVDHASAAQRIYERAGFRIAERSSSAVLEPASARSSRSPS